MRIVIDNGSYHLRNIGDVAMLQVCASRLTKLFPGAEIHVITTAPKLLHRYVPEARALSPVGRDHWCDAGIALGPLKRRLPKAARGWAEQAEQWIKHTSPQLVVGWRKKRGEQQREATRQMNEFVQLIASSDLVVASGGGYVTDPFEQQTIRLLGTLRLGTALGKATAMFGQGIGPVRAIGLFHAMRASLPAARVIGVRETRRGPEILRGIGVRDETIVATGDDAIELALDHAPANIGDQIGLNLRCVDGPSRAEHVRAEIGQIAGEFARKKRTRIAATPISQYKTDADAEVVEEILRQAKAPMIGGGRELDSPAAVIETIGRCRLVITGSYHAAVFALAQGIPAIGLARTEYYKDKFAGLFEQFESGGTLVALDEPDWRQSLNDRLTQSWRDAESQRPILLRAAKNQAQRAAAAYRKLAEPFERSILSA